MDKENERRLKNFANACNLICDIMKKCKKCLLPETHETINFDSEGTCNICNQYSDKKEKLYRMSRWKI